VWYSMTETDLTYSEKLVCMCQWSIHYYYYWYYSVVMLIQYSDIVFIVECLLTSIIRQILWCIDDCVILYIVIITAIIESYSIIVYWLIEILLYRSEICIIVWLMTNDRLQCGLIVIYYCYYWYCQYSIVSINEVVYSMIYYSWYYVFNHY